MECRDVRELLAPSIDGELDAQTERALAAHLESCAACGEYRRRQEALLDAIRSGASYHRAPAALRERIAAALPATAGAHSGAATPWWKFGWQILNGAGLVAAVCAAIVLVILLPQRPSADEQLADELVTSHVRALLTSHVIDVASSDQHTVKPWFNGKADFSPPVRDLAAEGFPLIGGRLDYVDRHPVAVVVYRRRQHVIDVFIWPAEGARAASVPARTIQGYHVTGKTTAGMTFRAVSDVDPADLKRLLDLL